MDREFVRQRIRDEEREIAAALGTRTSQRTERRQCRDFFFYIINIISRCITTNMVWAAGYVRSACDVKRECNQVTNALVLLARRCNHSAVREGQVPTCVWTFLNAD